MVYHVSAAHFLHSLHWQQIIGILDGSRSIESKQPHTGDICSHSVANRRVVICVRFDTVSRVMSPLPTVHSVVLIFRPAQSNNFQLKNENNPERLFYFYLVYFLCVCYC